MRGTDRFRRVRLNRHTSLVETSFGVDSIESVLGRVPTPLFRRWSRAGDLVMSVYILIWLLGFVLLPLVVLSGALNRAGPDLGGRTMTFDSAVVDPVGILWFIFVPADQVFVVIAALIVGVLAVIGAIIAIWLCFFGLLLFALPHEFAHVLAFVKHGTHLESYGLVMVGILPVGVYVRPAHDLQCNYGYPSVSQREIAAAGVAMDTVVGTVVGALGILIYLLGWEWAGTAIMILAGAWFVSALMNSLPFPGFDGRDYLFGYLRTMPGVARFRVIQPDRLEF